jgi:hypothetical protein
MAYRWCEQCGYGLSQEQYNRANYCGMCGANISKDARGMPVRDGPSGGLESMMPASAARHLQAVGDVFMNHPVFCSVGAIGVGAVGIALAPLLIVAGQSIMVLGGIVAGVSGYANHKSYNNEYGAGVKLGVGMLVAGAVVYGSSYVLLGASGLAVESLRPSP